MSRQETGVLINGRETTRKWRREPLKSLQTDSQMAPAGSVFCRGFEATRTQLPPRLLTR